MAERRSLKLTDDEVKGFSLRKEGRYTVEIVSVTEKKSKNGQDMYEIEYNVLEAPEGAQKGKIKDWALLEGEYTSTIVQLARATGFPVDNDFEIPLPEELEGKELVVEIKHQDATTKDAQGNKVPVLDDDGQQRVNANVGKRLSLEAAAKTAGAGAGRKTRVRKL